MNAPTAEQEPTRPSANARTDGHRFLLLDGLRGVAAIAVIFDHVPSGWVGDLIPHRYLAVDFFFVLSGFVLAHAYGSRLSEGWSPLSFMRVRLIRLYPLYLAGFALGFVVMLLNALRGWEGDPYKILIAGGFGLLFLPQPPTLGVAGGMLYPMNGASWSLFFELVANFLYALIARYLRWPVLIGILVVTAVFLVFAILRHGDVGGPGWLWPHFDAGLARVLFEFFAGVAIYRLWSTSNLPSLPWWLAMLAFLAVIAFPTDEAWIVAYDAFAAIILMPLLVATSAGSKVSAGIAGVCALLGTLSYGVYMLHGPIYAAMRSVLPSLGIDLGETWIAVALVTVTAGLAAYIANTIYDRPFRRWLNKAFAK